MAEAQGHTAKEVAQLLGLSLAEVRRCARAGFLTAQPDASGELRFSFQDLVLLRRAAALVSSRLRPHRVHQALKRLRDQLPEGRPLSGVDVSTEGRVILARQGEAVWDALSGQMQLNFQARTRPAAPSSSGARLLADVQQLSDPRGAARQYEEACALEESGQAAAAEAAYRRAVQLDPTHLDARVNLGCLLHETGRAAEAEPHYRVVLQSGPHSLASFNLAVALEDLGRVDEAIRAYQEAIAADPDCEDAYFNLSRIYERRGERAAALRALKTYRNLVRRR